MKNTKKFLIVLLLLTFAAVLFACGKSCTACVDENADARCDVCKKNMPNGSDGLLLINGGYADFQFVTPRSLSASVREALKNDVVNVLNEKLQAEVDVIIEDSEYDEEMEMEVLIGDVISRGDDYKFDRYSLGKDGYVIRIVGKKVIINAGSDESLIVAIEEFADKILGIDDDEISNVTMTSEDNILEVQDDYDVTSLAVNGTDMRGYTISADLTKMHYQLGTVNIQDAFYAETGYWFEIVDVTEATDRSIVVKRIEKTSGDDSFRIYASGSLLIIECAYDNMLDRATLEFIEQEIGSKSGNVNLTGELFKKDVSVVYYEDFGAVGDGKTEPEDDDFKEIYETHRFANECGQTVKANRDNRENCTYYIFDTTMGTSQVYSASIKTNVDWCGANFIIDDTQLVTNSTLYAFSYFGAHAKTMGEKNIFEVIPNNDHQKTTITDSDILESLNIGPNTTSIGNVIHEAIGGWNGPLMIIPYNSTHAVFRRIDGGSLTDGNAMQEIIVIEADGSISSETPIIFDYTKVTSIEVYKLDPSSAVTIKNGTFTTWETTVNHLYNGRRYGGYIKRGILVSRSYTTVENVEHAVKYGFNLKERAAGYEGASQSGFFRASYANHVTFKDCVIPGRMAYGNSSSYSFGATHVNKIVLDNCFQPNFWVTVGEAGNMKNATVRKSGAIGNAEKADINALEGMGYATVDGTTLMLCWGAGQSNFCKNMEYLNSTITRFDAHQGLHTGKVINSNVMGFEIIGFGEMLIEDSAIYNYSTGAAGNSLIYLRGDYGSTWDGDIILKNVKAYPYYVKTAAIVYHSYYNGYFGYDCHFPNIVLDNVTYWNKSTGKQINASERGQIRLLRSISQYSMHLDTLSDGTTINSNKILPPNYISVINNSKGYDYESIYSTAAYKKTTFFDDTVIGINSGDTTSFLKNAGNRQNQFTVVWKNWDGTPLETDSVLYGATPEYNGQTPTKAPTAEHSYAFAGWDCEISFVRGDVTYTARFVETT